MHRRNGFAAGIAALGAVLCGTVLALALDGGAFSYRDFPEPPAPRLVERGAPAAPGAVGRQRDLPSAGGRRRRSGSSESVERLVPLRRLRARRPAGGRAPRSGAGPGGQGEAFTPAVGGSEADRTRVKERVRRPLPPVGRRKRPRPVRKTPRPVPRPPRAPGPPTPTPPGPTLRPVTAPARDSGPAGSDHPARLGPRDTTPGEEPPQVPAGEGEGTTHLGGGEGTSGAGQRPPPEPVARRPLDEKAGPRYRQEVAVRGTAGAER